MAEKLPIPRRLLAAAVEGGKIHTFGGCGSPCFAPPLHISTFEERRVEVYDPRSDSWSLRKPMPEIVFGAAAAAPGDGRIYLFGGFVTGAAAYAYDPVADIWTAKRAMPTSRHGLAAVALNGKIYVLGGSSGTSALAALEIYDPATDSWRRGRPMPTARVFLAAAALNGRIYAIGGSPDCCGEAVTDAVEVYDPATDSWSRAAPLPIALQVSAAAAMNGRIYSIGGFIPGRGVQRSVFEYDPVANAWTEKAPLPVPRDQAPAVVIGGAIHVLGGSTACHCKALDDHPRFGPFEADLGITKDDGLAVVCPGQSLRYTIAVHNAGPSAVRGARVTDFISARLAGATWTCVASPGASCSPESPEPGAPIDDRVDLPVGATVTYTLSGTLDVGATGTVSNTASVEAPAGVTDPNPANDRDTDTDIVARDRLRIAKSHTPDTALPGEALSYEITVRNLCPAPLTTTVEDVLSAPGLENVRWCRLGTADCPPPSRQDDLRDTRRLPPGGTVTYLVSGDVPCDCRKPLLRVSNEACVTAPGQDKMCHEVETIARPPTADVSVELLGPGDLDDCGASYRITVSNGGRCTAPDVVLEIGAPAGFELVATSRPCLSGAPTSCELGDLAKDSEVEVTAEFKVAAGVSCPAAASTATARVRSGCDPDAANDSQELRTEVPCDLAITKSDGQAVAAGCDPILYTIGVKNTGCGAVAGARVTDACPEELQDSAWCRGANCAPATACDLMDELQLPPGGSETYRLQGTVPALFLGTITNTASVAPPGQAEDPTPQDNTATDVTEVSAPPGVSLRCETGAGASEGDTIDFTFVLVNGGPTPQGDNPGDEFEDVLPAGLTLTGAVASSGTIATAANTVTWNGVVPVGDFVTIVISATVDAGTTGETICNEATVFFDANGDGVNESSAPAAGSCAACCLEISSPAPIPALSPLVLAGFALVLAALSLAWLRTWMRRA